MDNLSWYPQQAEIHYVYTDIFLFRLKGDCYFYISLPFLLFLGVLEVWQKKPRMILVMSA